MIGPDDKILLCKWLRGLITTEYLKYVKEFEIFYDAIYEYIKKIWLILFA